MIFKPNPLLVPELEAEAAYALMLKGRAEDAKRESEAIAPVHTGYYKAHFGLVKSGKNWRLGNRDPFAHIVEWGSINSQPYSPLRRGVVAAGLHLREAPKP